MFTLNCKGRLLVIDRPIAMGIINVTHDSFYSGSRKPLIEEVLNQAEKMINEGAVILDIGGQTTRPGSKDIGVESELSRVIPAIEAVSKHFPEVILSIDTYHSRIAAETVAAGASIVNDISSGTLDHQMIKVVAALR